MEVIDSKNVLDRIIEEKELQIKNVNDVSYDKYNYSDNIFERIILWFDNFSTKNILMGLILIALSPLLIFIMIIIILLYAIYLLLKEILSIFKDVFNSLIIIINNINVYIKIYGTKGIKYYIEDIFIKRRLL